MQDKVYTLFVLSLMLMDENLLEERTHRAGRLGR